MADELEQHELARSIEGDGEAFAGIVRRYQRQVAQRLRPFCNQQLVLEELVQEVFVEAYCSLSKYRGTGPFAAWLSRIATRVGYRYWKRRGRSKEVTLDATWWKGVVERRLDEIGPTEASQVVHSLLDRLPPRDRLVVLLLYIEGCTVKEAAALAGWTATRVRVQAFRAREKLRAILVESGVDRWGVLDWVPRATPSLGALEPKESEK